jgi:Holliday junction resolvasome RuvABC ATP-dependent DNA helicase subunit
MNEQKPIHMWTDIPPIKPDLKVFNDKLFEGIVGQDKTKRAMRFYLDSYLATRLVPNMMIVAPKGQGKTTIAREFARGLYQFDENGEPIMAPSKLDPKIIKPKKKPFVEVNCSTLKSVKQFINGLIIPYVQDKDVTLLFDEASEIPRDITMALLTILNPNPDNRNTFAFDEYVCDFDFRRQTFIFATSEVQKVFHALTDRLERITLQDYTPTDLAAIVQKGVPDVKFEDGLLLDISAVLRGNARAAQKMSVKIATYLKNTKTFNKDQWKDLSAILGIMPLGLNELEIQIMRYLAMNMTGTSLTGMSAKTGMSRESLRQDSEIYLLKQNLMEIATTGRLLTAKGINYLRQLDGTAPSASSPVCAS